MLILPETLVLSPKQPLIFLVGPIKCAPAWQEQAIQTITQLDSEITIACPKNPLLVDFSHLLVTGEKTGFFRRRAWEWFYMDAAVQAGAIMCWLPTQEKYDPEVIYATTTERELGLWMMYCKLMGNSRFCIGSDGGFPTLGVIEYDLKKLLPGKTIYPSLLETCTEAVRIARS